MEQTQQQPSRNRLWIIVGIAVFILVMLGAIFYFVFGTVKPESTSTTATTTTTVTTATKEDVQKNLSEARETLKQATTDQAAAKAAMDDSKNQVKVGN